MSSTARRRKSSVEGIDKRTRSARDEYGTEFHVRRLFNFDLAGTEDARPTRPHSGQGL